ncbi:MAG: reverse transcriptase domain-containing protein [Candidatus Paceibacterota bacterium]|nr:MAG: reverse transcriptase domain-containing protein [Candidatus Paceibacterota bacterium]
MYNILQWASAHDFLRGKRIMHAINFTLAGRHLPIRKVYQLRLTNGLKSSTLNGEAIASAVASTLKGARSFGTCTGSSPVRSSIIENYVNLQLLLTQEQIASAFKSLRRKVFRKNFSDLKRFSGIEERELNDLGKYIKKISVAEFYSKELRRFSFLPYSGLKIRKSNGKYRPLLIPSSKDRIVLSAVFPKVCNILKPALEEYGALGLGIKKEKDTSECKRILNEIQRALKNGEARYILKLDFKDFFSSIDRSILLKQLSKKFRGKDQRRLFRLIKVSIENKIEADSDFHGTFGHLKLKTTGIPQGLSYSPFLSSYYALPLDKIPNKVKGCKGFRYLDDMIVLSKSEGQANNVYELIKSGSEKLKLKLHPLEVGSKTQLLNIDGNSFEFLGVGISKNSLFIPKEAIQEFKNTFEREIVNVGIVKKFDFGEVIKAYKSFAGGWVNHYKSICPDSFVEVEKELLTYLDQYIEKHRTRKTIKEFFGDYRLTLSKPFLRIK